MSSWHLGIFYLTALGYFLYSLHKDESDYFVVYASCLALLPWMKREGIILWFVLALLGLLTSWRKKTLRLFAISLLPSLVVIVSWRVYLMLVHVVAPSDFSSPTFSTLRANINRVVPICRELVVEMSETSHWSIFWLLAGVAIVYLLARFHHVRSRMLVGAIVVPIILYCAIYIFSAWSSYSAHITSSLPRLLLHVIPATWLTIATLVPLTKTRRQNITCSNLTT